jgi:hypothetical protein
MSSSSTIPPFWTLMFLRTTLEAHNGVLDTLGLAPWLDRDFITSQPFKGFPSPQ